MLHNNLYTTGYGKLVCYAVIYQVFNVLREHQAWSIVITASPLAAKYPIAVYT